MWQIYVGDFYWWVFCFVFIERKPVCVVMVFCYPWLFKNDLPGGRKFHGEMSARGKFVFKLNNGFDNVGYEKSRALRLDSRTSVKI